MQDTFKVFKINAEGKKFDKVSRIEAESENLEMYMKLDVNSDIYPVKLNDKFVVLLTTTLNKDGSAVSEYYTQTSGRESIADKFEYVMYGKIFKIQDDGTGSQIKLEIYVSFSGLLMLLKGNPSYISDFELDQKVFLCMRKVK